MTSINAPYSCFPFSISREDEMKLLPPQLNFEALKNVVMTEFRAATENAVMSCRDLIGGSNLDHFE